MGRITCTLLIAGSFALCVRAQPAPRQPSNAARILAGNTDRPGWRRFGGTWVQPSATFAWNDLVRMHVRDRRLVFDVLPSERAKTTMRADRRVVVEIENSPAIWVMSTAGRVWLDPERKVSSNNFSAWASYDRGLPIGQILPIVVRIAPTEKTIVGAGKLGNAVYQVTCQIRPTENGGVKLLVEKIDGPQRAAMVNIRGEDIVALAERNSAAVHQYLAPLLTSIAGTNPLRPQAGDVYRIFSEIPADKSVTAKLDDLLPKLESLAVEDRDAASSALESLGDAGVLAALRLDQSALSPEQRARISRFIDHHTLMNLEVEKARTDPFFLLDCLGYNDRAVRAAAKTALEKVLGHSIDYSPDLAEMQRTNAISKIENAIESAE